MLVGRRRRGWDALQFGVVIQVDMIKPEVIARAKLQAPFAVRGDAPAEVACHLDAFPMSALDLADVALDIA